MANMVTRTLTTFEVKASKVVVNRKKRIFEEVEVGTAEVTSLGKPSRKEVAAAFEAKGIHFEKGTEWEVKPIGYKKLGIPVEQFLAMAVEVED